MEKEDVLEYVERYGLKALGYAIYELVKQDELILDWDTINNIWEFDGNEGETAYLPEHFNADFDDFDD